MTGFRKLLTMRALLAFTIIVAAVRFLIAAFEPTSPDQRAALFKHRTGEVARAIPLMSEGDGRFSTQFHLPAIAPTARALDLYFSFPRNTGVVKARLTSVAHSKCAWTATPGENVTNNDRVTFDREPESDTAQCSAPGTWLLSAEGIKTSAMSILFVDEKVRAFSRVPSGLPSRSRAALLSYQWTGSLESPLVPAAVALLTIFLCSGVFFLLFPRRTGSRILTPVGFFVGLASLFGLWSLVVPPLQGPDEADHLLAGFSVKGATYDSAGLSKALALEARRVHFERLKFHADETFSTADTLRPFPFAWDSHVEGFDVAGRSALEAALFRAMSPPGGPLAEGSLFRYLLALRIVLGLWSLGCAAICGYFLTKLRTEETPAGYHAAFLLFALLPAVPHFATHVSNYGFLIGSVVLLLGVSAVRPRTEREGILKFAAFGVSLAFCCLSGRVGLTALVLLPLASLWKPAVRAVSVWKLWAVAFGSFALPVLFARPQSFAMLGNGFATIAAYAPGIPPNVLFLIPVFIACVAMTALDTSLSARTKEDPRLLSGSDPHELRPNNAEKKVIVTISACLSVLLIAPHFISLSPMPENETVFAIKGLSYVYEVLPRFVHGLGISDSGFFLSSSFWSGFGWLDTLFSRRFVRVLKCIPIALAFIALASWFFRTDGRRPMAFLVATWLLSFVVVCLQAFAISFERINLHGRYLTIPYMVLTAGSLLPLSMGRANRTLLWMPTMVLVTLAVCLQFHSLGFVLERFFE